MVLPWPDDGWMPARGGPARRTEDVDARLAREVTDRLLTDERTRRRRIVVEAQDRVVLLTGVVDSRQTRAAAGAVVRDMPGVRDVCNGLRTRVSGAPAGDAATPTGGLMDADAFDEMVAHLQARPGTPERSGRAASRQPGLQPVLIVSMVCLPLGAIIVAFGWAGMLIACGISALIVERLLHRRAV